MDMFSALLGKSLSGGGGSEPVLITKLISSNGTYDASDDNADGYSSVSVSVPNSYTAADEDKVVHNGELVAQGSDTVTTNGTVDTTLISSLTVNVPSAGGDFARMTPVDTSELETDNLYIFIPENALYGFIFGQVTAKTTLTEIRVNYPNQFPINKIGAIFKGCVISAGGTLGYLQFTKQESSISLSATTTTSGSYYWYSGYATPHTLIASFSVST